MMIRNTALLLLLTATSSSAFVVVGGPGASTAARFGVVTTTPSYSVAVTPTATVLFAKDEAAAAEEEEEAAVEEEEEEAAVEEEPEVEEAAEEAVAEEEPEIEDPAVTALKEEIANSESDLKGRKATLERIEEDAEKYTKSGYARRVAQVEDMKKIRMSMQSSNKETAVAAVVQNFLPVLDNLVDLKAKYGADDFGAKYAGLTGAMAGALKELGVKEYTVAEGDAVDAQRVTVVNEEHSSDVAKGSVIRPVSVGMELAGNVMRMAQVVASLGESEEEEAAVSEE